MLRQPSAHGRVLVRAVVIENEVDLEPVADLAIEMPQEAEELLMPVSGLVLGDDRPRGHVERRKLANRDWRTKDR